MASSSHPYHAPEVEDDLIDPDDGEPPHPGQQDGQDLPSYVRVVLGSVL